MKHGGACAGAADDPDVRGAEADDAREGRAVEGGDDGLGPGGPVVVPDGRADVGPADAPDVVGRAPPDAVDSGGFTRSKTTESSKTATAERIAQGEACLTNRRDRATNASMWRIEWKRRTARWQIENVLLFGSDEERQAVREAIEACGVDILSLDAATEGELTAALESLKK